MEYPFIPQVHEIKGTKVELIGVEHTKKYFEKFEDFYNEKISESDSVILEQTLGSNFWQENTFFGNLSKIAYEKDLSIYQVDPVNFSASVVGLSIYTSLILYANNISNNENLSNFMHTFNQLGSFLGACLFSGIDKKINSKKNKLEKYRSIFTLGLIDWRNIHIANGIEKICAKENLNNLKVFHGAAHTEPISFYLDHPNIRKTKKQLYLPYNLVGETKVRKYKQNEDIINAVESGKMWELEKKLI